MIVTLTCAACGQPFTRGYLRRHQRYCSHRCANGPNGSAFAERRRAVNDARLAEMRATGQKRCTYCGEVKPLAEFYVGRNGWPHSWCDGCRIAYSRARYQYEVRREMRARASA